MLHIKKVKPLFTSIVTTGDKFTEDNTSNGLIQQNEKKGDLKLYQRVLAVGSSVRDIKVGDMVMINAENYKIRKYSKDSLHNDLDDNPNIGYAFNWITLDDEEGKPQDCLLLNDRDILYVFEGEEIEDSKALKLIMPKVKKIIMS